MGVKPDLPGDQATHAKTDDLRLLELGREAGDQQVQHHQKELEPDEPITVPDSLLRVESLARVCSLSKILSQPKSRDLYETSEEEAESSSSTDAHLTKKLKDNGESPIPTKASLSSSFAFGSTARSSCGEQELNMQIIRVGIYTRAERQAKLDRYRAKKNRRTFSKKILYACRKSFADSRPRVGGRFVPLKDLPLASKPSSPESDQEVSEMLASISTNNKRATVDAKKSGKKVSQSEDVFDEDSRGSSPDSSLLSPVSLSRSFQALPRVPLHPSYSAPASTSSFAPQYMPSPNYVSFDGFGFPEPILAPQHSEPSYASPAQPIFSYYPSCSFSSFPSSPPLTVRSSSARGSNFTRSASRPSRSAIDDPSASLLLLSLAATQAAVS